MCFVWSCSCLARTHRWKQSLHLVCVILILFWCFSFVLLNGCVLCDRVHCLAILLLIRFYSLSVFIEWWCSLSLSLMLLYLSYWYIAIFSISSQDEFFIKLSLIAKGRRLVVRALAVLSPEQLHYVLLAYVRNFRIFVDPPKSKEAVCMCACVFFRSLIHFSCEFSMSYVSIVYFLRSYVLISLCVCLLF